MTRHSPPGADEPHTAASPAPGSKSCLSLDFLVLATAEALVVPLAAARPATSLNGMTLPRVDGGDSIDIGAALSGTSGGKTMLVLGTHASDFNMVEYMQKVRAAWAGLTDKGITTCLMTVNGDAEQASKLAAMVDLPSEIVLLADPTGEAARRFGCSRGFRPDDERLSPFAKLFCMGIGIGLCWSPNKL